MSAPRLPPGTIDAHVHVGLARYGPVEPLIAAMDRLGMRHAVLVQYRWHADDRYLLASAARYPGRFAVVGYVDPNGPDPVGTLSGEVAAGLQGLRLAPDARSPGRRPFALWAAAETLGLVVSVTGPPETVASPAFARLVRRFPGLRFRLEHLGGIRARATAPRVVRAVLRLADAPNVVTMWSGFWLNAGDAWPYAAARPVVRDSLTAFGATRICWSGDRDRPDLTDGAYVAEAGLLERSFGVDDPVARAQILGGTARSLFAFG